MQHRLHELLRGLEIEQRPLNRAFTHLEDAALLVPDRIGLGAHRNTHGWFTTRKRALGDLCSEREDFFLRANVALFHMSGRRLRRGCRW